VAAEVQDAYGQPIPGWSDVPGLVDLPCSVAPFGGSTENAERWRADGIIERITHAISIAGHYTAILNKMRAVVAGVNYNIVGAEVDSHATMTRLKVVLVQ